VRKFKVDWQIVLLVLSGLSLLFFLWAFGHYSFFADKAEGYEVSAKMYKLSKWFLAGLIISLICFFVTGRRAKIKLQNFLRGLGKKSGKKKFRRSGKKKSHK